MRLKLGKICVFGLAGLICSAVFGINGGYPTNPVLANPSLRNPSAMRGTTPVSSYRRGLIRSPNPIDRTSDLIFTGNIGGGKHFRGFVPYNAITDFGGRIGEGTLDDFLRRSTISPGYYSGKLTPYYSHTNTVARIVPGTNMVFVPPTSRIRTNFSAADVLLTPTTRAGRVQTPPYPGLDRVQFFPIGTQPIETFIPTDEPLESTGRLKKVDEKFKTDLTQFNEQVAGFQQRAESLQKGLVDEESSGETSRSNRQYQELFADDRPMGLESLNKEPEEEGPKSIYERMLEEYEQTHQRYELSLVETDKTDGSELDQPGLFQPPERKTQKVGANESAPARRRSTPAKSIEEERLSEDELLARAQRLLSEQTTFAVRSQDKFNQNMQLAEQYMRQGKFYLAADTYTMATIYKPLDPLGYAGKCHALFAAGDYLSSALYLTKAIDIFNGYADFKVDVAAMIGDIDTVEKRISDVRNWIEVSNAPELHFLLAYFYMQLDRGGQADAAIEAAYERMPDVSAVRILKEAVDRRFGQ